MLNTKQKLIGPSQPSIWLTLISLYLNLVPILEKYETAYTFEFTKYTFVQPYN